MIVFECPRRGNKPRVKPDLAGKQGKCSCGASVTVPSPAPPGGRAYETGERERVVALEPLYLLASSAEEQRQGRWGRA